MKPEELLYSLDHVGEDLLAAAEQTVLSRQRRPWLKTAVAAAFVLAIGAGSFLLLKNLQARNPAVGTDSPVVTMPTPNVDPTDPTDPESALPPLRVGQTVRGMSVLPLADMEAYLASNPWREEQRLNTLPVYRAEELEKGALSAQEEALLLPRALETLECGPVKDYLSVEAEDGSVFLKAGTELGTLRIDSRGQITLLLDPEHRLTPELPARTDADPPEEETLIRCWLDYLSQITKLNPASRWARVEGVAPASVTVAGADGPLYQAEVYPLLSGSERSQAVAYGLERVTLLYRDNTLWGFTLPGLRLYESHLEEVQYDGVEAEGELPGTETPVGDPLMWDYAGSYPLLSPEAARAMAWEGRALLSSEETEITGNYLDLPTGYEDPAQIPMELIYLPNETGELMLPFYRFLWPAGADEDGNTICHLSYVPAIDPAYLKDWPRTEGQTETPDYDGFTQVLEGDRSWFTDGETEIRLENGAVTRTVLATGVTELLFSQPAGDDTVTELVGVTPERLYFGWNDAEVYHDIGGLDVYSVDYQNQDRKELAQNQEILCKDGWIILEDHRTDVGMTALKVIDRSDRIVLELNRSWGGAVVDGCCWYIYAPSLEDWDAISELSEEERDALFQNMRYDVCRIQRDGEITLVGSMETPYYAAEFRIDPEAREIRRGFGSGLPNLDLYTLQPKGTDASLTEGVSADTEAAIRGLFEDWTGWYTRATLSYYADPLEADLEQLFYLGISEAPEVELTPETLERLTELAGYDVSELLVQYMPGTEVDKVLTRLFGLDRNVYVQAGKGSLDTLLGEDVIYLQEYDCYFGFRSDSIGGPVTVLSMGQTDDGRIAVNYKSSNGMTCCAVLRPGEQGGFRIYSNLEGAWNLPAKLPLTDLALDSLDPEATDLGIGIKLLQNDEQRVIFYGYFGLLALDSRSGALLFSVDFDKALDCNGQHSIEGGEPGVSAAISVDGTKLKLSYGDLDQIYDSCLIDLEAGTYRKNDPAAQNIPWASLDSVNSYGVWGTDDWQLATLWLLRDGEPWYPFRAD